MVLRRTAAAIADPDELEALQSALTSELVSDEALVAIISPADRTGQVEEAHPRVVSRFLSMLGGQYVPVVAECLSKSVEPSVRSALFHFIEARIIGQEVVIGDLILASDADLDLALELVSLLSRVDTREAAEAVSRATASAHPLVRIAVLGLMQNASDEQIRGEVRTLLEDSNPQVRLNALQAIERHQLTFVGPALVVRIRTPEFNSLPYEERAQSISTLCTLWPDRAEEVCSDILAEAHWFPRATVEETRELAAHGLGRIAVRSQSVELLEKIANGGRLRNSKRVRGAARAASGVIAARVASSSFTPAYGHEPVTSGSLMACDQRDMSYVHRRVVKKRE
jgi:hypothetical protein